MTKRQRAAAMLMGTAALLLLELVAAALAWRLQGGHWYDVKTPSMGTAAPVGTLLLTQPSSMDDIRVGDVITFRAPGSRETYSHRVAKVTSAGVLTKGDVNPVRDAWTLHQGDLVGKVVVLVPGAGWVLKGFPLALVCAAGVGVVQALVRPSWRRHVRVLGFSATFTVIGLVLHPWVGLERLSTTALTHGVRLQMVSTGLIPVRVKPWHGGRSVRLDSGAVGSVHVAREDHHHFYSVATALSPGLWWSVALVAMCLFPIIWSMVGAAAAGSFTDDPDALPEGAS